MKIKQLTLNHFRAFYGEHTFNFDGQNVLLYGENGSGKTSLYYALKTLIKAGSGVENEEVNKYFNPKSDTFLGNAFAYANAPDESLSLDVVFDDESNYTLTEGEAPQEDKRLKHTFLFNPFLHYKRVLQVYISSRREIHKENNLYTFFKTILQGYPLDLEQNRFLIDLANEDNAEAFDKHLKGIIQDLKEDFSNYLLAFNNDIKLVEIDLEEATIKFANPKILLNVSFFNRELPKYHHFLNEARLSSLALSLYFAIIKKIYKEINKECLKILVLDDLLLSLEMANRAIVLKILEKEFSDFQIIFLTHDKALFNFFKNRTDDKKWKYFEMYADTQKIEVDGEMQTIQVPFVVQNSNNDLSKAKRFFVQKEYECCALYLRKSLENICKKSLNEQEKRDKNCVELDLSKLLDKLQSKFNDNADIQAIITKIQNIRQEILNPSLHDNPEVPIFREELDEAIKLVEELQTKLGSSQERK